MHFKVDWIVGCADADFPPETKLCYEYVRVHLGFYVCSPSSTGLCSLGMDPAMNLPNSYTSHILSIEIQNCETEVATALTKICPFWGNGGSRHLMGVHAKKRGFTQVSRKFHAVGFLGVHTVYLKASLQCWTTLARNLTVSSIAALDVFFGIAIEYWPIFATLLTHTVSFFHYPCRLNIDQCFLLAAA